MSAWRRIRDGALGLALAFWGAAAAPGEEGSLGMGPEPRFVTLTVQGDPKSTAVVTWRASVSAEAGQVVYSSVSAAGKEKTVEARDEIWRVREPGFKGTCKIYHVALNGLTPNTTYRYRVACGEAMSPSYSFTTAPSGPDPFKFLVFGDSQSGSDASLDYSEWGAVASSAFERNPKARFFMNVGDLVETGQRYEHWDRWFAAASSLLPNAFCLPVQGNHDEYADARGKCAYPSCFVKQFPLPQNGPKSQAGRAYSFNYGAAHLVVLNSQFDEEKGFDSSMLETQAKWLADDLSSSTAKWTIAFFHKPPYHVKIGRPNEAVRKAFCPVLEEHGVDLVFNGHDHALARTFPTRGKSPAPGGEGTIYYLTGRSGPKFYKDSDPSAWDEFFYNPSDLPNYIVVDVAVDCVTVKAFKSNGVPIDRLILRKPFSRPSKH
jgi:hypothetical protein